MRDLYEALGVGRDADQATIRKAFKKLAREFHPDLNKDPKAADRFKEVNAAYEVLGDEEKRSLYDEFGETSLRPGFDAIQARAYKSRYGGFPGGGGGRGGFGGGVDIEEVLGSFFTGGGGFGGGFGGGPPRPVAGADVEHTIQISLLDAIQGKTESLTLRRPGRATVQESLKVHIPPGVGEGQVIRLRGKGGEGQRGGPAGDLLLTVEIAPHPLLKREGADLSMEVPLTIAEAMGGGRVEVPTLDGPVRVNVPPGATNGQRLRLRGKGVPSAGGRGDLYLVLRPTPPARTDAEALQLAAALDPLYDGDVRANLKL